jgi:hypothetical protein
MEHDLSVSSRDDSYAALKADALSAPPGNIDGVKREFSNATTKAHMLVSFIA